MNPETGCEACLFYGVRWELDHSLGYDFVEQFGLQMAVTATIKGLGQDFLYGIEVKEWGVITVKDRKLVNDFAKQFRLGTPTFSPAIMGDFEYNEVEFPN
jgi:hypothetical protein